MCQTHCYPAAAHPPGKFVRNHHAGDSLKRLDRLIQIQQAYVSVAEANLEYAEGEVRRLRLSQEQVAAKIQGVREAIAYLNTATAGDVQNLEKYIETLQVNRKQIDKSLEDAIANLAQRRSEWTEAMREQKLIERAQKRWSQQWEREKELRRRILQDDVTVNRHIQK